jgi:hypothetical protein
VTDQGAVAEPLRVTVSDIGEFIRFQSCERRFKLSYNKRQEAKRLPFYERLFNVLDPVLAQAGADREQAWAEQLIEAGSTELTPLPPEPDDDGTVRPRRSSWPDFAAALAELSEGAEAFGREVEIDGVIGAFEVRGAVDFIVLEWDSGEPKLKVIEGKASRRDRTYHRIQVVAYVMLLRDLLRDAPLTIAGEKLTPESVIAVVARIEEDTGRPQVVQELDELIDVDREEADLERLLAAGGPLARITATSLPELQFQLAGKCDGCVFNIDCLSESGRERRLELLSLEPSVASALREHGVADIDELADLDLDSDTARDLRRRPGFSESLRRLKERAKARRATLPRGAEDPDDYPVGTLRGPGSSQLPEHEFDGQRLVRVYLTVDYDVAENRVGALTAHVTNSDHELHTAFQKVGDKWRPDPDIHERKREWVEEDGNRRNAVTDERDLDLRDSRTICHVMPSAWRGNPDEDTGAEKVLLQGFLSQLVETISEIVQPEDQCRLHFYVWSANEMNQLVEACSRVDTGLLGHLRQLLGARESLEQMIYSDLGTEIGRRFGLGWTSRGLVVATSLSWFGSAYHWHRRILGKEVDLDRIFEQDLFDFKTELGLDGEGDWVEDRETAAVRHRFEIRSRNFDSLPAPYWRAMWGTLPDAKELNSTQVKAALDRYARADSTNIRAYLSARAEALRWVEERVSWRNSEIEKPAIPLEELPRFDLGVNDIARASIDFLRLDHHVGMTRWLSEHLAAVEDRVALGSSLPLKNLVHAGGDLLRATIDLDGFDSDPAALQASWAEGGWSRVTIRGEDPERGQTLRQLTRAGMTGQITGIDWEAGTVDIEARGGRKPTRYVLSSSGPDFLGDKDFATLDSSPSDFVAGHVETRLIDHATAAAVSWLDPINPEIPDAPEPDGEGLGRIELVVRSLRPSRGLPLADAQVEAIMDGLGARISLLQGPPGTGKTVTAAVAVLTRILLRRSAGDTIAIGASTHAAVDILLGRIADLRHEFEQKASEQGLTLPPLSLLRIASDPPDGCEEIGTTGITRKLGGHLAGGVVVVAGTTSGLLRLRKSLDAVKTDFDPVDELIVDEASMLVFPHFLALATMISADGFVMLAGDNRQLAPIVAHDWENEDRPPVEIYQPHLSAFDAIANLAAADGNTSRQITRGSLNLSFRLPPDVIRLIRRVYAADQIDLQGLDREVSPEEEFGTDPWEGIWRGDGGIFLVVHDERRSRKANPTEVEIITDIVKAEGGGEAADIAVITPHRAQRQLLSDSLGGSVDVVDTVERLQGGERKAIIVSATASDPSAIAGYESFILDLNRSNVAFSRVEERLVVVVSASLLDHIPAELENYDNAMLWKALRSTCDELVAETVLEDGAQVQVLVPSRAAAAQISGDDIEPIVPGE